MLKKNWYFVCFPEKNSNFDLGLEKNFSKGNTTKFYAKNHYFLKIFSFLKSSSNSWKKTPISVKIRQKTIELQSNYKNQRFLHQISPELTTEHHMMISLKFLGVSRRVIKIPITPKFSGDSCQVRHKES